MCPGATRNLTHHGSRRRPEQSIDCSRNRRGSMSRGRERPRHSGGARPFRRIKPITIQTQSSRRARAGFIAEGRCRSTPFLQTRGASIRFMETYWSGSRTVGAILRRRCRLMDRLTSGIASIGSFEEEHCRIRRLSCVLLIRKVTEQRCAARLSVFALLDLSDSRRVYGRMLRRASNFHRALEILGCTLTAATRPQASCGHRGSRAVSRFSPLRRV